MPSRIASSSTCMSTPPPKKKKGGFFGCFSKSALDSLPRNARGDAAAIIRLQAQDVFQHNAVASDSSAATAAVTPLTEEKGLLKLAELKNADPHLPSPASPITPLYAQEVLHGDSDQPTDFGQQHNQDKTNENENENEEARDIVPDDVPLSGPAQTNTPGAIRSLSVTSKTGRIRRSLSLKRSGSTASANLIARAPPVSSADFADLPALSSSASDLTERGDVTQGDMLSIRKARGRHETGNESLFFDASEDLAFDNVPIPPPLFPVSVRSEEDPSTPLKKRTLALSMPESHRMRAVEAALEGSTDSVRYQPGPRASTPRLESPSPSKTAYTAELQDQWCERSQDTVTELASATTASRGFWDAVPELDKSLGPGRTIPFQYVTNIARPVSIASLRSLACPNTPPRTSSRPTSPDGAYHGLRSTKSFSVSALKRQATFNGFPRTFFPPSTLKHVPSTASQQQQSRRKPAPEVTPSLIIQHRARPEQHLLDKDDVKEQDDAERQLTSHAGHAGHAASRSHTCPNCGVVEETRDFAAFVSKGKASRRTSAKQQTINKAPQTAATGSLRKSKSALLKQDTLGENTLKRWGLAEAFKSAQAQEQEQQLQQQVQAQKPTKKMVPGPAGGYITDTANVRWCSALDEIKKALALDEPATQAELDKQNEQEASLHKETLAALAQADALLARLGVQT